MNSYGKSRIFTFLLIILIFGLVLFGVVMLKKNISNYKKSKNLADKIEIHDACGIVSEYSPIFYTDENYIYRLETHKTGCIYITIDSKRYTLRESLYDKIVTIDDLKEAGLEFIKEEKKS